MSLRSAYAPQAVPPESTAKGRNIEVRSRHAGLPVARQQHLGTLIVHTTTAGTSVFLDLLGKARRIRVEGHLSAREPRAWAPDRRTGGLDAWQPSDPG